MKCLTTQEQQAVLDFLSFLNTQEAWHIPSITAHLSVCGSRYSLFNELSNQVNMDMDHYPPKGDAIFSFLAVGDLYTPTLCFDRVRGELLFTTEGDMRDELESFGYVADPVHPFALPLPCVLSEGTCKLSDILPILFDTICSYDPDRANEIALDLYKERVDLSSEDLDQDAQDFWYSELEEAVNEYLEEHDLYIGTHEDDPACLGVWRIDQEDEDQEDEDSE